VEPLRTGTFSSGCGGILGTQSLVTAAQRGGLAGFFSHEAASALSYGLNYDVEGRDDGAVWSKHVNPWKTLIRKVDIDHAGGDAAVSHKLLNVKRRKFAAGSQLRPKRVAQTVEGHIAQPELATYKSREASGKLAAIPRLPILMGEQVAVAAGLLCKQLL